MAKKSIVITGASSGLGFELCKLLAAREMPAFKLPPDYAEDTAIGYDIIVACGRSHKRLTEAIEKLNAMACNGVVFIPQLVDMTDPKGIKTAALNIAKLLEGEKVFCLVNNVGIAPAHGDHSEAAFEKVLQVNVGGPAQFATDLLPSMADGGRIVNVSSQLSQKKRFHKEIQGRVDTLMTVEDACTFPHLTDSTTTSWKLMPLGYEYAVSKYILNRSSYLMMESADFKSKGITFNLVCPGWCKTPLGCGQTTGENALIRGAASLMARPPRKGGMSILHLVRHPEPNPKGGFFSDGRQIPF